MESVVILIVSLVCFALAYRFYSPYIAKRLGMEPARPTPAHTMKDGIDYYPAKMPVLFGHHFASIAGAAPIVGPIIAITYGWLPVILWVIFGGIFLGAVHDFAALIASIRHSGRSMGEVMGAYMGRAGKMLFLFFLWATLVLLIGSYLNVVAITFKAEPEAATSSMLFIPLAVVFGFAIYRSNFPVGISTVFGVIFLAVCMVIGWYAPISLSVNAWIWILLAYIFVASVAPVWILLQPRDYLNSFLLYALLIMAFIGIFAARPDVKLPAFVAWIDPELGPLFPILFVTVACGAISGFHSVVSGGTTAKQLNREADARPIGYGAMLVESLVSVLAIIVAMSLVRTDYVSSMGTVGPVALFAQNLGAFFSKVGIDAARGTDFAALAVSAFVLTTLDTATRLARFAFQEFFAPKEGRPASVLNTNRYIGTAVTVTASAFLAFSGGWKAIWPIFGSANQLLAALALMAVALWIKAKAMKYGFLKIPMIIMFAITLSALVAIFVKDISAGHYQLAVVSAALFVLAVWLIAKSVAVFKRAS